MANFLWGDKKLKWQQSMSRKQQYFIIAGRDISAPNNHSTMQAIQGRVVDRYLRHTGHCGIVVDSSGTFNRFLLAYPG
jgi:hypothetical protein